MTWLEPDTNFCDVCGCRIVGDRGETHPCPWAPHDEPKDAA